jgi:hypothetical protein
MAGQETAKKPLFLEIFAKFFKGTSIFVKKEERNNRYTHFLWGACWVLFFHIKF